MKKDNVTLGLDQCLGDEAGVLGIVGDHALAKEQVVFGCIWEQFRRASGR